MKRFITYLYAYRDGQKTKNTGHIRVDVRNQIMNMQVSIKDADLENEIGTFYIIVKKETIEEILLEEIRVQNGQYNGRISCKYEEDVIGIRICYENGAYMASCWRDGEEEVVANIDLRESDKLSEELKQETEECNDSEKMQVMAASISEESSDVQFQEMEIIDFEIEPTYRKVNLNEIYTLPSKYWHFSNNSFLIHGFWNYGYLVLKEIMEENEKRMSLGVPGIFEQPEMVMATYFGFPKFEALPSQVVEMEIDQMCPGQKKEKNQEPKAGTFGCWFVEL